MNILGGSQVPSRYSWKSIKRIRRYVQAKMKVTIMVFGHGEIAHSGPRYDTTLCPGEPQMTMIVNEWGTLAERLAKTGLTLPLNP